MVTSFIEPRTTGAYPVGSLTLFAAVAVILTALAFEHIGGYSPCPLCLQQRWAYYAAIPLLFVALVMVSSQKPKLATALFLFVALAFLANGGLGAYHAGVEWKFWPGPETCSAAQPLPGSVNDLMAGLNSGHVSRCDDASWRFLGLSFAGWNVLASLALFAGALRAAALSAQEHDAIA